MFGRYWTFPLVGSKFQYLEEVRKFARPIGEGTVCPTEFMLLSKECLKPSK